jgi:putative hydrolase of the HAD superfamily
MPDPKQPTRAPCAVSLDALGTMVGMAPPWELLGPELGMEVDERLVAAVRAEMAFYREHCHLARDAASLAELRERCANVLSEGLGREVSVEAMMRSIRFQAYPDAGPALAALRERGLGLVCVSNWDCSLPRVLEGCGLASALDGVVTSASAGARKPDPAIFEPALDITGCEPGGLVHVGDTAGEDVAGARAAGARALLLDRDGGGDIASLTEIPGRLDSMGA